MRNSASFREPTRTQLGWVRRVLHSDVTLGMLGGKSFLSPKEALQWVGLDIRKRTDRAIWSHFCSHRVLLEGVALDDANQAIHYECRGAHRLDTKGGIEGFERRNALPLPEGAQWGYEPSSVALLRRTMDVPMVGAPTLADSHGKNVWIVGTPTIKSLDEDALEPPFQRRNLHLGPDIFNAAGRLRLAAIVDQVLKEFSIESDSALIARYGADAVEVKQALSTLPEHLRIELMLKRAMMVDALASEILMQHPETLGLSPEQRGVGKRSRPYSMPYVSYPAGPITMEHRVGDETITEGMSQLGRLAEIEFAYDALRRTGHVEELAPSLELPGLGITLSPIFEVPSDLPPEFIRQEAKHASHKDGDELKMVLKAAQGPAEYRRFIELQGYLICAHIHEQFARVGSVPTKSVMKTCPDCLTEFEAVDGRQRRCLACRMGSDPKAYNAKRQRQLRARKRSEPPA